MQKHRTGWSRVLLGSLLAVSVVAAKDEKEDMGPVVGIDLGTTYSWYFWLYLTLSNIGAIRFCYFLPSPI